MSAPPHQKKNNNNNNNNKKKKPGYIAKLQEHTSTAPQTTTTSQNKPEKNTNQKFNKKNQNKQNNKNDKNDQNVLSNILQKPKAHHNHHQPRQQSEDAATASTSEQQKSAAAVPTPVVVAPQFSRELDLVNFPRMTYKTSKQRPNVLKGLHLGQRKLLLSEIEFLSLALDEEENPLGIVREDNNNSNNNNTSSSSYHLMIYAGAAPGGHTPFLSRELFPKNVAFLLVDPAPFDDSLCSISQHVIVGENAQETPGLAQKTKSDLVSKDFDLAAVLPSKAGDITILRDYCTPELCSKIRIALSQKARQSSSSSSSASSSATATAPRSVLFVSDIRVGDMNRNCTNAEATEIIMQDNELQKQCCEALQPEAAMLKFRPPFPKDTNPHSPQYDKDDHTPDEINYYQGKVFFGVWAPKSSTETRLIVSKFGTNNPGQKYNCKSFEEQLCYYNLSDRYQSDVKAEAEILRRYLKIADFSASSSLLLSASSSSGKTVEGLSARISKALGHGSALFQPLLPSDQYSESDSRLWVLLFIGCHLAGAGDHPLERKKNQQQVSNETLQKATEIFEQLRKEVTIEKVVSGANDTDEMKMFWKKYASAMRLGESYCFLPWIHGKLVPRFHHSNNNNNQNNKNQNNNNNKGNQQHHDAVRRPRTSGGAPESTENSRKKFDDDDE